MAEQTTFTSDTGLLQTNVQELYQKRTQLKKELSRIDRSLKDHEIFKIERGHLDAKFKTTRDFKAEILRLIDNRIDLLKEELKKAISIERF